MPWPSGPEVVSTPLVQRYSGCPGHFEPSWRKRLRSSSRDCGLAQDLVLGVDRADASEVEERPEQRGGVARGEHEAIAVRPDRVCRIEP